MKILKDFSLHNPILSKSYFPFQKSEKSGLSTKKEKAPSKRWKVVLASTAAMAALGAIGKIVSRSFFVKEIFKDNQSVEEISLSVRDALKNNSSLSLDRVAIQHTISLTLKPQIVMDSLMINPFGLQEGSSVLFNQTVKKEEHSMQSSISSSPLQKVIENRGYLQNSANPSISSSKNIAGFKEKAPPTAPNQTKEKIPGHATRVPSLPLDGRPFLREPREEEQPKKVEFSKDRGASFSSKVIAIGGGAIALALGILCYVCYRRFGQRHIALLAPFSNRPSIPRLPSPPPGSFSFGNNVRPMNPLNPSIQTIPHFAIRSAHRDDEEEKEHPQASHFQNRKSRHEERGMDNNSPVKIIKKGSTLIYDWGENNGNRRPDDHPIISSNMVALLNQPCSNVGRDNIDTDTSIDEQLARELSNEINRENTPSYYCQIQRSLDGKDEGDPYTEEDLQIPPEFLIEGNNQRYYHLGNLILTLLTQSVPQDMFDRTSIGEEQLSLFADQMGIPAEEFLSIWFLTSDQSPESAPTNRWPDVQAQLRTDYRFLSFHRLLQSSQHEASKKMLAFLKEKETWRPEVWEQEFPQFPSPRVGRFSPYLQELIRQEEANDT